MIRNNYDQPLIEMDSEHITYCDYEGIEQVIPIEKIFKSPTEFKTICQIMEYNESDKNTFLIKLFQYMMRNEIFHQLPMGIDMEDSYKCIEFNNSYRFVFHTLHIQDSSTIKLIYNEFWECPYGSCDNTRSNLEVTCNVNTTTDQDTLLDVPINRPYFCEDKPDPILTIKMMDLIETCIERYLYF